MSATRTTSGFSLYLVIQHFLKRRRDARSLRAIAELPDYVLDDIGVTRYDVMASLHPHWGDTPSACLQRAAAEKRLHLSAANDASLRKDVDRPVHLAA